MIDRRSPFEAMRASFGHVSEHPGWNLKVWGVVFLASMVLSYVPIVGAVAAVVCSASFTLRAARQSGVLHDEVASAAASAT